MCEREKEERERDRVCVGEREGVCVRERVCVRVGVWVCEGTPLGCRLNITKTWVGESVGV